METRDPHDAAAQALRTTLQRCVRGLIADLDGAGRAHMAIPAMRVEGREQVALADKVRTAAKRAGLL